MLQNTQPPLQGVPHRQQQYEYGAQQSEHHPQLAHTPQQQQLEVQQQPRQPGPSHGLRYAHLANMPFFVLSDADAAAQVAHSARQAAIFHDYCLGELQPERRPELTPLEKVGKLALEVYTGVDLISPDQMQNNLLKMTMAVNHLAILDTQLTDHLILTRLTLLPVEAGQPLVVDVLECFSTRVKWAGRNIVVKANRPVELRVRGKYVANLHKTKSLQKGWTKSFNKKPVDSMALVVDGKDVPLELVLRVKRVVTSTEQTPIYVRFWKEWLVPM
ncbi:hypothetical protein QBC37DRAFT_369909 [Rhypophila decipiens]|uniref:Uncharacterized protein n=1 Tax=Rhypophila decipiens TaxID=261697 RepID=A0AAN6YFD4_9PEZI|nr:hypothetical protein QBC37DRAFT_369909 [Rhypophila decipiens]